jgi:hypothetical protein
MRSLTKLMSSWSWFTPCEILKTNYKNIITSPAFVDKPYIQGRRPCWPVWT